MTDRALCNWVRAFQIQILKDETFLTYQAKQVGRVQRMIRIMLTAGKKSKKDQILAALQLPEAFLFTLCFARKIDQFENQRSSAEGGKLKCEWILQREKT